MLQQNRRSNDGRTAEFTLHMGLLSSDRMCLGCGLACREPSENHKRTFAAAWVRLKWGWGRPALGRPNDFTQMDCNLSVFLFPHH